MKGRKKSAALRRLNGCRGCCVWERVAGTGGYRWKKHPPDLAQSLSPVASTTFCPYGMHERSKCTRTTKKARPGEPWAIFNKTRTIILIFLGMFSFNSFFFFPCRRIIHWQKVLGFNFFFSSFLPRLTPNWEIYFNAPRKSSSLAHTTHVIWRPVHRHTSRFWKTGKL